jgi:hypothetical protein
MLEHTYTHPFLYIQKIGEANPPNGMASSTCSHLSKISQQGASNWVLSTHVIKMIESGSMRYVGHEAQTEYYPNAKLHVI